MRMLTPPKFATNDLKHSIQAAIASMTMERMDLELEKDNFQDHRVIISEKINQVHHTLATMSR